MKTTANMTIESVTMEFTREEAIILMVLLGNITTPASKTGKFVDNAYNQLDKELPGICLGAEYMAIRQSNIEVGIEISW